MKTIRAGVALMGRRRGGGRRGRKWSRDKWSRYHHLRSLQRERVLGLMRVPLVLMRLLLLKLVVKVRMKWNVTVQ